MLVHLLPCTRPFGSGLSRVCSVKGRVVTISVSVGHLGPVIATPSAAHRQAQGIQDSEGVAALHKAVRMDPEVGTSHHFHVL